MKSFYSPSPSASADAGSSVELTLPLYSRARVAVYEAPLAAPRIEEVASVSAGEYIEAISTRVYELARSQGGTIPYTVVREVAENLIHASFREPVVSVLDGGNTIRFADQGPGITDKTGAVRPGFTTATGEMKAHIRGVGSGLPLVQDFLNLSGGKLLIEDNLGCGAVITITRPSSQPPCRETPWGSPSPVCAHSEPQQPLDFTLPAGSRRPPLTNRQKQVLALVMESGSAGPSLVSKELSVGISTAYRDLASLEEMGLISAESGKRTLTDEGMAYLDELMTGS